VQEWVEVAHLFHSVWHETQAQLQDPRQARAHPSAFFAARVESRSATTLAALAGDQLAGFATWTSGMLNSLFVKKEFRGQGIGEALCPRAEAEMAATGATEFELDCIRGNTAGRRFYERQGWRVSHIEQLENETPEGLCQIKAWRMIKP
jgi:GNAT superfamily N-acetyltransferase